MSASASAAAAASASSAEPANAVPSAAIRWISTQLASSSGGRAATDRATYLPTRGLDALQLKDLKALCTALQSLVDDALAGGSGNDGSGGGGAATLTAQQLDAYTRFSKPKSGAKKALWMAAVRRCFYTDNDCTVVAPADDPIWALLKSNSGGASKASSRSATRSAAAASAPAPSRPAAAATAAAPHGMPDLHYQLQQQLMGFGSFSPSYYSGGGASALSFAGSPFAASAAAAVATSASAGAMATSSNAQQKPKKAPSRKRPAPTLSLPPPAAPDYVDFFVPESQWPPPNTNGGLALLVKIKQEEEHRAAATSTSASASASASAYASSRPSSTLSHNDDDDDDDDGDRPRNMREMNLLGQLRTMGFTDQREMLAGLRHVMKDGAGGYLDSGTILENSMMWIISQREETEEAKKMDAARIMAENDQVEEERRRKEAERRLEDAPIEDIVGAAAGAASAEGGGKQDNGVAAAAAAGAAQAATPSKHKAGRSKYFHFSVLLHSPLVRSVFLSIACPEAKKELVRLLRLEQKANQWYGSVLPWAYFTYVATSRIEKWANDESGGSSGSDAEATKGETGGEKAHDITALIRNEANILERALFALSEQHDNGLQNVPKIFIEARDDCAKKGLPDGPEGHATGDKSIDNGDDDVVLVMGTFSGATKKSVDDNDLDKKPAALPVASPNGSSHSPHRTCASSEPKRPAKASSDVIEIM